MKKEEILDFNEHLFPTYNRFPIVLTSGKGSRLYDEDGKEYIDFMGGIAVNSLGYGDEGLVETVTNQIQNLQHISNLYYSEPLKKAADTLAQATGFDEVFFTNSGA